MQIWFLRKSRLYLPNINMIYQIVPLFSWWLTLHLTSWNNNCWGSNVISFDCLLARKLREDLNYFQSNVFYLLFSFSNVVSNMLALFLYLDSQFNEIEKKTCIWRASLMQIAWRKTKLPQELKANFRLITFMRKNWKYSRQYSELLSNFSS